MPLSAAATAFMIAPAAPAFTADIVERASVVDGDTLVIQGERIRLSGVDASESWQRCEDAKGKKYRCGKVPAIALDEWLAVHGPLC